MNADLRSGDPVIGSSGDRKPKPTTEALRHGEEQKLTANERGLSRMERRVKFEAETNYNKRFRLTRRDCIGSVGPTPTTETQRHGEEQHPEESSPRRRGGNRNFSCRSAQT